jgi:hypothetical protein
MAKFQGQIYFIAQKHIFLSIKYHIYVPKVDIIESYVYAIYFFPDESYLCLDKRDSSLNCVPKSILQAVASVAKIC